MNVLICPCGEGLGHTTRCRALAEEFIRQGHKVAFAAYGSSAAYLRRYKFRVYDSEAEISLAGKSGKFSMRHTLMNSKGVFYKMLKSTYKECRAIEDFRADMVISDTKYSALLAAKIKGLKSIIIVNQNTMSMHGIKKFIGYVVYGSIKNLNKIADRIVVPDFAPPYTVCEYNISQKNNKMYFSGPLIVSKKWRSENRNEKYVLSLIGGFGYRSRILKKISMLALKRKDKMFKLVCGISSIKGLKSGKNIEIINFAKNMDPLWSDCEMVVAHGGHSTLMEMACFGKPGIIIPDADHFEQENNARKISELGCGITIMHKDLFLGSLNNAINQISKNEKYKRNAKKLGLLARKYDAKKNIVKMALSLNKSRAKPTNYWKKIFLQN
ncbi:hypothetical protein D4Q76_00875 [archaeon]|nr:MAG: hypothetical protein D4Q76_00875 [archaeon]